MTVQHKPTRSLISIHAPRVGSDAGHCGQCFFKVISIHAPRVGSDPAHRS